MITLTLCLLMQQPAPQIVNEINVIRKSYNLPPYIPDQRLNQVAISWSQTMANRRRMGHERLMQRISQAYRNRAAGEIVASGPEPIKGWMNSQPHRAIILGNYKLIGAGVTNNYWSVDVIR